MTPAQNATLRAYIEANPVWMAYPHNSNGSDDIAKQLNALTADYYVWNNQTPIQSIYDSIVWANLTPAAAPDTTAIYTNRALQCQAKQINLQILIQGRDTVDASKTSVRAGLQDSLTNLCSGAGGAVVSAGWTAVRDSMKKLATGLEKVLATGAGTQASPSVTSDVMTTSFYEIQQLMDWG